MARAKQQNSALLDTLAGVFRSNGFEGASLNRLASAAGLEKASLYHRFPGGKEEMAEATLGSIGAWFEEHIILPLAAPGEPRLKLKQVSRELRRFYADGKLPCVLESLSLPGGSPALHAALKRALEAWLAVFAALARESGASSEDGQLRAEQAIAAIQGSLVLSRVLGDNKPFLRALDQLPSLLIS